MACSSKFKCSLACCAGRVSSVFVRNDPPLPLGQHRLTPCRPCCSRAGVHPTPTGRVLPVGSCRGTPLSADSHEATRGHTFPLGRFEEISREDDRGPQPSRELFTNVLEPWHPGSREVKLVEDVHGEDCGDIVPSHTMPDPSHGQLSAAITNSKPGGWLSLTDGL